LINIEENPELISILENFRNQKAELKAYQNELKNKIKEIQYAIDEANDEKQIEKLKQIKDRYRILFAVKSVELLDLSKKEARKIGLSKNSKLGIGLTSATAIIAFSTKGYDIFEKEIENRCSRLSEEKRKTCIIKLKEKYTKDRIRFLKNSITNCYGADDYVKCKKMLNKEIVRLEFSLSNLTNRLVNAFTRRLEPKTYDLKRNK